MPRRKAKSPVSAKCDRFAGDFARIADVALGIAEYGDAKKRTLFIKGSMVGPDGGEIFYNFKCNSWRKFGAGPCASFKIERSGPGTAKLGLKKTANVGNLHGLVEQLSRDAAAAHGCKPGPTSGFEGARRRRRR
jgi:hypothetical protein